MRRSPGRLICRFLGHVWDALLDADGRVCRLCRRCAETQWHK